MTWNIRRQVISGAVALGLLCAGGVAQAPSAEAACTNLQTVFANAILTRQYVYNVSSTASFWMYQDHKRGSSSAKIGKDVTGGKGRAYCGSVYYHSTSSSL
jgi:hypothetical protein